MMDNIFQFPKTTVIRFDDEWPNYKQSYTELEVARILRGDDILVSDAAGAIYMIGAYLDVANVGISTVDIARTNNGFLLTFARTNPFDVSPQSTKVTYSVGDLDPIFQNWPLGESRKVMCLDSGDMSIFDGTELPWIQVDWAARKKEFMAKYDLED